MFDIKIWFFLLAVTLAASSEETSAKCAQKSQGSVLLQRQTASQAGGLISEDFTGNASANASWLNTSSANGSSTPAPQVNASAGNSTPAPASNASASYGNSTPAAHANANSTPAHTSNASAHNNSTPAHTSNASAHSNSTPAHESNSSVHKNSTPAHTSNASADGNSSHAHTSNVSAHGNSTPAHTGNASAQDHNPPQNNTTVETNHTHNGYWVPLESFNVSNASSGNSSNVSNATTATLRNTSHQTGQHDVHPHDHNGTTNHTGQHGGHPHDHNGTAPPHPPPVPPPPPPQPETLCAGEAPDGASINVIKRDIATYARVAQYMPGVAKFVPKDVDTNFLDFTYAFANAGNQRISVLVTQSLSTGSWDDYSGELAGYGSMQDQGNYFELALDLERSMLDIYSPAMSRRTSDRESELAVHKATGDGWLGSLPLVSCPSPQDNNIVIDAANLLDVGFFIFPVDQFYTYRVTTSKAYKDNFDIALEMLGDFSVEVTFSMVMLPPVPMTPRPSDPRLLFFSTDYTDLGFHQAGSKELPSDAIDRKASMIWKFDTDRIPDSTIRIYVDPTVPERWRRFFRQGIDAWQDAFKQLHKPTFVKGVCPGDADWPDDYDVADARFSTVVWQISEEVASVGLAKVDPRSGEIMKGDVIMADGWVWAYLEDLDFLAPGITHEIMGCSSEERLQLLQAESKQRKLRPDPQEKDHRASLSTGLSLISAARLKNQTLSSQEVADIIGSGLRSVVMHEVGHILGLRHMFKGSLYTNHACLQDKKCTSVEGIGATVMDYTPVNFPDPGAEVDFFTPVIGHYDKLAIRYGYMDTSHGELEVVLKEAEKYEKYGICFDEDISTDQDPYCATEDLGPDPVDFHQSQFERIKTVQSWLLEATVQPDESFEVYGKAVEFILRQTSLLMSELLPWIGGIQNFYAFNEESHGTARKPVAPERQLAAVNLSLRLLHLDSEGLLPGPAGLPYLVDGDLQEGSIHSIDIIGEAENLTASLASALLSKARLEKVHLQQQLLGENQDPGKNSKVHLSVLEYLGTLNQGILMFGNLSNLEMNVQKTYITAFVSLYSSELHEELAAEVLLALRWANQMVKDAADKGSQSLVEEAHLTLLQSLLSKVFCPPNETCSAPKVSEEPLEPEDVNTPNATSTKNSETAGSGIKWILMLLCLLRLVH